MTSKTSRGLLAGLFSLIAATDPLLGQPDTPSAEKPSESTIQLDPFNVTASTTGRYLASNSVSGTAMNMLLKDVPMTINVITSEFLEDANLDEAARALDYNSSIAQTQRSEIFSRAGLFAIRGFRNRNLLQDGVLSSDFLPTFLIDRIEVVKGPNTLYGQSDPGGLINMITKRPSNKTGGSLKMKYGSFDTMVGEIDANFAGVVSGLNVRLLGSYTDTGGWRWIDGTKSRFGAAIAEWQIMERTKLHFLISANGKEGQPSYRINFPFVEVPTDLNGDGDTADTVNGLVEGAVRFNADFVPRPYTSNTKNSVLELDGTFLQASIQQAVGANVDFLYAYVRSHQTTESSTRALNTILANGNNVPEFTNDRDLAITDAHTLNANARVKTGPFSHSLLAGLRHTKDHTLIEKFRLRPGTASERAVLNALNASGRNIRFNVPRSDIENEVPIYLDDIPTIQELKQAGFRGNNLGDAFETVRALYLSDSVSTLNGRLRLLGGVRNIEIESKSFLISGPSHGPFARVPTTTCSPVSRRNIVSATTSSPTSAPANPSVVPRPMRSRVCSRSTSWRKKYAPRTRT
jgi:outer membrane receptor for monomeric catechols